MRGMLGRRKGLQFVTIVGFIEKEKTVAGGQTQSERNGKRRPGLADTGPSRRPERIGTQGGENYQKCSRREDECALWETRFDLFQWPL